MYWSLQGKCYVAERDSSGNAKAFRFMNDVSGLTVQLATDILEHNEHTTGQRLTDLRFERTKSSSMVATLDDPTKENIALALRSVAGTIAAGSVTNEVLPSALVVGDIVKTVKPKISAVVVKDSAGSPATLVLNTDYSIEDATAGMIKILNLGAYTQPFKVDYSNALVDNIPMFTQGLLERWFRFIGVNTADANKKMMIDLYKVSFDPARELGLITDDITKFELNGGVLYDATKVADAVLGQFGRVVFLET